MVGGRSFSRVVWLVVGHFRELCGLYVYPMGKAKGAIGANGKLLIEIQRGGEEKKHGQPR